MKKELLPICVDLDGTLVKTDTLVEATLTVIKKNPALVVRLLVWLMGGKAYFKNEVASRAELRVEHLPYNEKLLEYLREQQAKGHPLYVVTAAHPQIAAAVAEHLGIFAGVLANNQISLAGPAKAAAAVERFGAGGFLYAGNSLADVSVWQAAHGAIVVNARPAVVAAARKVATVVLVIPRERAAWRTICRLVRCHQWVKNVLVFVPVIAAHTISLATIVPAGLAFVSFCLISSSVYVFNDIFDVAVDRQHQTKRRRPLAAGKVSLVAAMGLVLFLLMAGLGMGWSVSLLFVSWLLAYLVLTTAYSLYLKRLVVVDVVVLAVLYTLRIFAGAAAVTVSVSEWLFVFSLFLFMSLALLKRFTELVHLPSQRTNALAGRGYRRSDLVPIGSLGMASGYLSVLVLALYISSAEITVLYGRSYILWLLVPVLICWLSRVWILAYRDEVHDDPVVFATRDGLSYILLSMSLVIVFSAT